MINSTMGIKKNSKSQSYMLLHDWKKCILLWVVNNLFQWFKVLEIYFENYNNVKGLLFVFFFLCTWAVIYDGNEFLRYFKTCCTHFNHQNVCVLCRRHFKILLGVSVEKSYWHLAVSHLSFVDVFFVSGNIFLPLFTLESLLRILCVRECICEFAKKKKHH